MPPRAPTPAGGGGSQHRTRTRGARRPSAGRQRHLLDRPAITVQTPQRIGETGRFVANRVPGNADRESPYTETPGSRLSRGEHEVVQTWAWIVQPPPTGRGIRGRGGNRPAFVGAGQGTHPLPYAGRRPGLIGGQDIAPRRKVARHPRHKAWHAPVSRAATPKPADHEDFVGLQGAPACVTARRCRAASLRSLGSARRRSRTRGKRTLPTERRPRPPQDDGRRACRPQTIVLARQPLSRGRRSRPDHRRPGGTLHNHGLPGPSCSTTGASRTRVWMAQPHTRGPRQNGARRRRGVPVGSAGKTAPRLRRKRPEISAQSNQNRARFVRRARRLRSHQQERNTVDYGRHRASLSV